MTKAETLEYLKNWMAQRKFTPTYDPVVPEWLCIEMLHMKEQDFINYVLLDDSPIKPVYRESERFYRLDDIESPLIY